MDNILRFEKRGDNDENKEEVRLDTEKAADMVEFLTSFMVTDGRSHNKQSVAIRRKGFVGVEDNWLIERVNQSSKTDWQARPNFYHALIEELQGRGMF